MFNYKEHRQMWDWLANNPDKDKHDWPGWSKHGMFVPMYHCFACSFASNFRPECHAYPDRCVYCPLVWPGGNCTTMQSDMVMPICDEVPDKHLFSYWESPNTTTKAKVQIAEYIRDLRVRPFAMRNDTCPDCISAFSMLRKLAPYYAEYIMVGSEEPLPASVLYNRVLNMHTLFTADYGNHMVDNYMYRVSAAGIDKCYMNGDFVSYIVTRVK